MNKLGRTIGFTLPESMIHHIQSFMTAKEAAQTTILSKSWYNAWLTRPTIDLDVQDFSYPSNQFEAFAKKTVQRYQDLNLKIESLRVCGGIDHLWIKNLIATAMKFGATAVELELPYTISSVLLSLPQEVFASETPLKLSVYWSRLEGNYFIRCSRLKSLALKVVLFGCGDDRVFKDLTTSCVALEELAVSQCSGLEISRVNLNELHKLRRLHLECMIIDSLFFSDFVSRFPCLKDLSIVYCPCTSIHIASTSLETISYKPSSDAYRAEFYVPNIRKFTCASIGLPSKISVNGALHEWEFDISISTRKVPEKTWFSNLKSLVENQFRRSRIVSLSLCLIDCRQTPLPEAEVDVEKAEPKPLEVENLRITDTRWSCALLVRLFGIFHPKMITHCLHSKDYCRLKYRRYYYEKEALDMLCRKLTQQIIGPNCGVPEQDMFGKFGVKRVDVEAMDKFGKEWRPLALEKPLDAATIPVVYKRKVRFHLIRD